MCRFFPLVCMIFVSTYSVMGQANNCDNVGFEEGNMNGWKVTNGIIANDGVSVVYTNEVSGTVENEHIITNRSSGNDPKIHQEKIPMVAPGSDYSVRIGNVNRGSKFDRLKKTFTITAENTLFQYKFAVILQDDYNGHATYQKPGFNVKLTDEIGKEVGCSYYDIQLQPQTVADGFKTQNDLQYRNWTTVAMDLRNYVGKKLTVEVTVHGCTKKIHFGYAYFDAFCAKSEVELVSSCPDANGYLTFKAPEGFEKYTWSNGAITSTARIKANIGDKVSVKMTPYNSLNVNCDLNLEYTVDTKIARSFIPKSICNGESYTFFGKTYSTSGSYSETLKQTGSGCDSIVTLNLRVLPLLTEVRKINLCEGEKYNSIRSEYKTAGVFRERVTGNVSCDSLITFDVKVNPLVRYAYFETICEGKNIKVGNMIYHTTGNYTTTIKRSNQCDSVVLTALVVQPRFQITITNDKALIEKGETVSLNMTVNPSGIYQYLWNHQESLSCTSCINPISTPSATTTYNVTVTPANGLCPQSQTAMVTVSCGLWLPNAFTPNNDGMNDILYIYSTKCIQKINEFQVYDRWGELIFRDQNFQASDPLHGWDGIFKGKLVLPDTYNYNISATYRDGEIGNFSGTINVMY